MHFYYPLRLGVRKQVPRTRGETSDKPPREYESWREGLSRSLFEYEEQPEQRVLEQLTRVPSSTGFSLILGEPGSGKSTLLENWFLRLAQELPIPTLGMLVPVFVRLREVSEETWKIRNEAHLANGLWELGLANKALLGETPSQIYERRSGRSFRPLWLLDGLDEIRSSLGSESLYQMLAILPGVKAISIRSAVHVSIRGTADKYKKTEHELLPLTPQDQEKFLRCVLRGGNGEAGKLLKKIQGNIQVRLLAGNPLLLGLMAEVASGSQGEKFELPGSRSEFYRQAVDALWHRKLKDEPSVLHLWEERDEFLTRAAEAMGLNVLKKRFSSRSVELRDGLRKSGLLRVDDRSGEYEFVHLTFHEYYLARFLAQEDFKSVLQKHWNNPRYEETLGLLVSILLREERFIDIEEGIQWLVQWARETHAANPNVLWNLVCSPLRVALHILGRSALQMEGSGLAKLSALLEELVLNASVSRRRALSSDRFTPSMLLAKLAQDKDKDVRMHVAYNASAGPEVLAMLAQDENNGVRQGVACNASAGPELLAKLAQDENAEVRRDVARNASASPELLAKLAQDENEGVRMYVAHNASAGPELLAKLSQDKDEHVRWGVAYNSSAGPELLAKLSKDKDEYVRWGVANNASASPELLAKLAQDGGGVVRRYVAENASASPELLAKLAQDEHGFVRGGVAGNASAGPELLAKLARDNDEHVRRGVARNASASPEVLAKLAQDKDKDVRMCVACNASAGPELLAKLAQDENADVRWGVAENANALLEDL